MFCLLPQYNTMQYKSLFLHPGHTNLAYEEQYNIERRYFTIRQIKERGWGEEVKLKHNDINILNRVFYVFTQD